MSSEHLEASGDPVGSRSGGDLVVVHNSEVTADQIDHLGHMNVRYYGQAARTGALALAEAVGVVGGDGPEVAQQDLYMRHHREQRLGAKVPGRAGVLGAGGGGPRR